ncbi:uncharacterized protein znf365 isoform 2-T2 [Spinachia spinachia]
MQQKVCSRGCGSFLSESNDQPRCTAASCDLPFRCPRCDEAERFRSLASLRAHLEYRHSYRSPDVTSSSDFSITGKLPDPLTAAIPWQDSSLPSRSGTQGAWRPPNVRSLSDSRDSGYPHSYGSARRRTQSVGVGTQAEEDDEDDDEVEFGSEDEAEEDDDDDEREERDGRRNEEEIRMSSKKSDACHHRMNHHRHLPFPPSAPLGRPPDPDVDLDLDLVELVLWLPDGGLGRGAPAAGPHPAGGRQHHAAAPGRGEHGARPDRHGAPVRARPLAAPGSGEAGDGGPGAVAEPAGGRGGHGDRRAEGAAQRLGERAGAEREGGDNHPEVFGGGGSAGDERESSHPALHRGSAETHRSGRRAGGVLPGQRQPAAVQPLQVPAANR